jgi:hypothetical protein
MNRTNGERRSLPPSSTAPRTTAAHATASTATASTWREVDPDAERWDDDGGYNYPTPRATGSTSGGYGTPLWRTSPTPRPFPGRPRLRPSPSRRQPRGTRGPRSRATTRGTATAAIPTSRPFSFGLGASACRSPPASSSATSPAGTPDSPAQLSEWTSLPDLPRFLPVSYLVCPPGMLPADVPGLADRRRARNSTRPALMSTIPAASQGHGLHSVMQLWAVAVVVHI